MQLLDVFELGYSCQFYRMFQYIEEPIVYVRGEGRLLNSVEEVHNILENEKIATDILEDISKFVDRLDKNYPKEDMKLKKADALKLVKAAERWRDKIKKELSNIPILRIELQSGLNPNELRKVAEKSPSEFIAAEVWIKLTTIEKSDFSDAARCLLLGSATPSVMVALRGAEASIRNYYYHKTKSDPGKKTWRQLTQELKSKAKTLGIEDTFIGYLDYIGDAKRNFAQHPNKIYSLREAVIIFMQVVGLVEDIYAQI